MTSLAVGCAESEDTAPNVSSGGHASAGKGGADTQSAGEGGSAGSGGSGGIAGEGGSAGSGGSGGIAGEGGGLAGEGGGAGQAAGASGAAGNGGSNTTTGGSAGGTSVIHLPENNRAALMGGDGGAVHSDDICAGDQALVGANFFLDDGGYLYGIEMICGNLALSGSTVLVAPTSPLPLRGNSKEKQNVVQEVCPPGSVMAGFGGNATPDEIWALEVRCASLTVSDKISVLTANGLGVVGNAGTTPISGTACEQGRQVMRGAYVHSGAWLFGIGAICSPIVLQ